MRSFLGGSNSEIYCFAQLLDFASLSTHKWCHTCMDIAKLMPSGKKILSVHCSWNFKNAFKGGTKQEYTNAVVMFVCACMNSNVLLVLACFSCGCATLVVTCCPLGWCHISRVFGFFLCLCPHSVSVDLAVLLSVFVSLFSLFQTFSWTLSVLLNVSTVYLFTLSSLSHIAHLCEFWFITVMFLFSPETNM